ncbi:hypothetical protein BKG59_05680 [Mycobacteroides chelonae]|nr:hypothetical protein BKG63_24030 [Mycobacteroides chelonae]OHT99546.1 hypothetical protein BKG72_03700 [Mycobacteroides chelonae]OLT92921.1 hypothetical protein BKG59_05680 [Mycobacteroides chelonae]
MINPRLQQFPQLVCVLCGKIDLVVDSVDTEINWSIGGGFAIQVIDVGDGYFLSHWGSFHLFEWLERTITILERLSTILF